MRYALREVPAHLANDVVAETFLTTWRRLDEVPDPALPWLLGVARRVVANQRRGEQRRERLRLAAADQAGDQARNPADALAERDAVRTALGRLSQSDRELLMLIGWDGLTVRQAAVVLGTTAGATSVRLHRARRRLAAGLARENAPDGGAPVESPVPERAER
jgi:RNA polymerase sigma-70 factor (ECF subfamily)